MPGVRGQEEDRRGEDADVDLGRLLQDAEVELLDDAEHRVARVAALSSGSAEQRLVLAVPAGHRQRDERDGGQREVDREHGDPHAVDRGRDRVRLVLGLLGHVRDVSMPV